jgi:hypothetical protein
VTPAVAYGAGNSSGGDAGERCGVTEAVGDAAAGVGTTAVGGGEACCVGVGAWTGGAAEGAACEVCGDRERVTWRCRARWARVEERVVLVCSGAFFAGSLTGVVGRARTACGWGCDAESGCLP